MATDAEFRPDWPEEFDEHVAALGPPVSAHRTAPGVAGRRLLGGFALLAVGLLANYLYWVALGGPIVIEKFLLLLLFGMPIYGVVLLTKAYTDRGVWILAYPTGLLRWQRGRVVSFPWAEVEGLKIKRFTAGVLIARGLESGREFAPDVGEPAAPPASLPPVEGIDGLTFAFDLTGGGSRLFGLEIEVRRADGESAALPSSLTDFAALAKLLQFATFARLAAPLAEKLDAGYRVDLGAFALDSLGLHRTRELLAWYDYGGVRVADGKLSLLRAGKKRAWLDAPAGEVANPHVVAGLTALARLRNLADAEPGA